MYRRALEAESYVMLVPSLISFRSILKNIEILNITIILEIGLLMLKATSLAFGLDFDIGIRYTEKVNGKILENGSKLFRSFIRL